MVSKASASEEAPTPPAPSEGPAANPVEAVPLQAPTKAKATGKKKAKKKKKGKDKAGSIGSSRGIETMYRTSYRTHIDLSGLADNKANIMISINGIILTVVIASVAPRIVSDVWLLIPATMLLLTGLCSMIFAVLCARPRVLSRIVTLDDVRGNRANILFFGNFTNMTEADYVEGMTELMLEPERIYHNMSRDIYGLGRVLKLKFKLLRVSYTIFMWGLTLSVATFLILAVVQYQLNT